MQQQPETERSWKGTGSFSPSVLTLNPTCPGCSVALAIGFPVGFRNGLRRHGCFFVPWQDVLREKNPWPRFPPLCYTLSALGWRGWNVKVNAVYICQFPQLRITNSSGQHWEDIDLDCFSICLSMDVINFHTVFLFAIFASLQHGTHGTGKFDIAMLLTFFDHCIKGIALKYNETWLSNSWYKPMKVIS